MNKLEILKRTGTPGKGQLMAFLASLFVACALAAGIPQGALAAPTTAAPLKEAAISTASADKPTKEEVDKAKERVDKAQVAKDKARAQLDKAIADDAKAKKDETKKVEGLKAQHEAAKKKVDAATRKSDRAKADLDTAYKLVSDKRAEYNSEKGNVDKAYNAFTEKIGEVKEHESTMNKAHKAYSDLQATKDDQERKVAEADEAHWGKLSEAQYGETVSVLLMEKVNDLRVQAGLNALPFASGAMAEKATEWSRHMAQSPGGHIFHEKPGKGYFGVENVAFNPKKTAPNTMAELLFSQFVHSYGHFKGFLNGNISVQAAGAYRNEKGTYITWRGHYASAAIVKESTVYTLDDSEKVTRVSHISPIVYTPELNRELAANNPLKDEHGAIVFDQETGRPVPDPQPVYWPKTTALYEDLNTAPKQALDYAPLDEPVVVAFEHPVTDGEIEVAWNDYREKYATYDKSYKAMSAAHETFLATQERAKGLYQEFFQARDDADRKTVAYDNSLNELRKSKDAERRAASLLESATTVAKREQDRRNALIGNARSSLQAANLAYTRALDAYREVLGRHNASEGSGKPVSVGTPTILSANQVAFGKAKVSWTPVEGAHGYAVWRKVGKADSTLVAHVQGTSYVDANAGTRGATFYFVSAYVDPSAGERVYGKRSGYRFVMADKPLPVFGVTSSGTPNGSVNVSWQHTKDAEGYHVFRKDGKTGSFKYLGSVSKTASSYVDRKPSLGEFNFYRVYAYATRNDGTSAVGTPGNYSYAYGRLGRPDFFRAKTAQGGVVLSWKLVEGAERYLIYRVANGVRTLVGWVNAGKPTVFVDTKAPKDTQVTYQIYASATIGGATVNSPGPQVVTVRI